MSCFIGIAIVFMAIFSLNYLTRVKFAIVFPIVNLSIIFILYIFGLLGGLLAGAISIMCVSVVLFVVSIALIIKRKEKQFVKQFFNPTVVLLITFCVLQFVMLFAFKPNWWDELSHWGLVVKNMYYHNDFGGGIASTTMFKGYPVGTSLYLYFFQVFGMQFFDGALIMALNILNISLLMPILSKVSDNRKKIATALFMVTVVFVMHYMFLFTICNDMFLSLCFAFILTMYFCFKREGLTAQHYLAILLAMFVLCIAKSTGLALTGFACLIIFVDVLVTHGIKTCLKSKWLYISLISVFATILASKLSWNLYLKHLNNPDAWQTSALTIKNILMYIVKPTKYQLKVTGKYLLNLIVTFSVNGSRGTTPIPFVIYAVVIVWLLKRVKTELGHGERKSLCITIFVSFAIWIIALLVLYIFTFTEREALTLSSQLRYVNCLGIGFIVFLLSYNISLLGVSDKFALSPKLISASVCAVVGVCLIMCPIICKLSEAHYGEFDRFENYVMQLDTEDRIYVIDCETETKIKYVYRQNWKEDSLVEISHEKGLRALTMRYIATPLNVSGMNVGGSPHSGDVWVEDVDIAETKQVISAGGYNYVYLHNIDSDFVDNYTEIFKDSPQQQTLYRIIWSGDNMTLERC